MFTFSSLLSRDRPDIPNLYSYFQLKSQWRLVKDPMEIIFWNFHAQCHLKFQDDYSSCTLGIHIPACKKEEEEAKGSASWLLKDESQYLPLVRI
jgi:hypothetical protein